MTFTCGSILQVEVFIMPQTLTFSTAVFLTCACTYIRKVPQFIVKCMEIETKVGKIVLNIVTFCNWSKISFIYTKRINSTGIRVHSVSYGRHIVLPTKPKKSASKSAQEKSKSFANIVEKNYMQRPPFPLRKGSNSFLPEYPISFFPPLNCSDSAMRVTERFRI